MGKHKIIAVSSIRTEMSQIDSKDSEAFHNIQPFYSLFCCSHVCSHPFFFIFFTSQWLSRIMGRSTR